MKAIVCDGFGEADVMKVSDLVIDIPKVNEELQEVLLKIEATAVNRADIL